MRDKFDSAYNFVYRHRGTFGYAAGIAVGCVVIATAKRHPVQMAMIAEGSIEKCVEILSETGVLDVADAAGNRLMIIASDAPGLLPAA